MTGIVALRCPEAFIYIPPTCFSLGCPCYVPCTTVSHVSQCLASQPLVQGQLVLTLIAEGGVRQCPKPEEEFEVKFTENLDADIGKKVIENACLPTQVFREPSPLKISPVAT